MERIQTLWREAESIWEENRLRPEFRAFVASDYAEVYRALLELQGRVVNLLEWGSGLGVITTMASLLGFEAYGIEKEADLIEWSRHLAKKYGATSRFFRGSFIPGDYEWNPECADESFCSDADVEPAYDELDMELADFDLVSAFPWPEERGLFEDIMRQCGNPSAFFMCYEAREGLTVRRLGQ